MKHFYFRRVTKRIVRREECWFCLYFSARLVLSKRKPSQQNAIVVSLSNSSSLISFLFHGFLIISWVNIWSTIGLGYFRKCAYVNLPSCHWQRDLHHNTAHERGLILHSQNLPVPLSLWTSIKPFITMHCNSFHFYNTGMLDAPFFLPDSASTDPVLSLRYCV